MTRTQDLRLLELEAEAGWPDVEEAYRRLMHRYSIGGLASYGLLRVEDRRRFLLLLQEAYQRLRESAGETFVDDMPQSQPSFPDLTPFSPSSESGHPLAEERGDATPPPLLPSEEEALGELFERSSKERVGAMEQGTKDGVGEKAVGSQPSHELHHRGVSPPFSLPKQTFQLVLAKPKTTAAQNLAKPSTMAMQTEKIQVGWDGPFSGMRLRQIREERSLSLEKVARSCGVSKETIAALEAEHYALLGSSRQIRLLLTSYARVVEVEARQVLIDYLASYWGWRIQEGVSRG